MEKQLAIEQQPAVKEPLDRWNGSREPGSIRQQGELGSP
jgi:hypothetical protein